MKGYLLLIIFSVIVIAGCGQRADTSLWGEPAPVLADRPTARINILVLGGTSGVGRETVKLALERGHHVVAAARRPERMTMTNTRLRAVRADILDAESVADAIEGIDAIVIAIGIPPTREPVTVFSLGTANVLAAMQHHGVNRLITVTGIGAGDSRGHGGFFYDTILQPFVLKTLYEDKDRSEGLVEGSDTHWTIVRPSFLTDEAARHRYRVISDLNGVTSGDIAREDVAHFIVSAIEAHSHIGRHVLITE